MANKKKKRKSFPLANTATPAKNTGEKAKNKPASRPPRGQVFRETIESFVIAFVLALLFRTFQAEAFVIPTGSMAPTLMGRHKDVECSQCGQRYKVNASSEADSPSRLNNQLSNRLSNFRPLDYSSSEKRYLVETVAGVCPTCRFPMAYSSDLPRGSQPLELAPKRQSSYNGDRILVNKFLYAFREPERWDVVVFKYPGNASENYIKRLVGLPNEELRIEHGDLFVRPLDSRDAYRIADKPPSKMLAMRQLVHDTDHDAAALEKVGWPLRWSSDEQAGAKWSVEKTVEQKRVRQVYRVGNDQNSQTAWLRYRHTPASGAEWAAAIRKRNDFARPTPQLISDYNAYNSQIMRVELGRQGFDLPDKNAGLHWVGDLMVEAQVEVQSEAGELVLELVEAGRHFTCTFDLATGQAKLGIADFETREPLANFAPQASTAVRGAGRHELRLANFDDQLTLWVDGSVVEFDATTQYDAETVFGSRQQVRPQASQTDPGDLAPVGIGARNAAIAVDRLQVWRDIYYIADSWLNRGQDATATGLVTDFPLTRSPLRSRFEVETGAGNFPALRVCLDQKNWPALASRRVVRFETEADQFFVMGDNSAASSDARLWKDSTKENGRPGGAYLERKLLIGKAVCVYWPHSWRFLIPNFTDMRLVR